MKDEASNLIVYCTVPDEAAGRKIAEAVVQERLCACVNRIPGVVSHYIFEGVYCEECEELLIIKTTGRTFETLKERIESLHPYDVPEIIATEISAGNTPYLQWLEGCVR